jgi:cytochrome d ubiquinol oxidase subunit II
MATAWFVLVAFLLIGYVVLDGFDLGAGAVHLLVARTDAERRQLLQSIGPVWDGNEVWLVAAGGTIFFAFPALYAASFSGFYLPLMIVLWLLMLRGIAVEFRSHIDSPVWGPLWDVVFAISSMALAALFGAALGNVLRGVSLDASGRFFAPLWTDFGLGGLVGILDWYTVPVALLALVALVMHGALWVALKTEGALAARARTAALAAWWAVAGLTALVTALTWTVQPQVEARLGAAPWGYAFPAVALLGLSGVRFLAGTDRPGRAFGASCAYLSGMLASAAFGIFPFVLPSHPHSGRGLTVAGAAAPDHGLALGLAWWVPGMLLVAGYFAFTYHRFRGKVRLEDQA